MSDRQLLGIFGGTFDPVHCGHLRVLLDVSHALQLDRVILVPNHIPPHRQAARLTSDKRLSLLRKAVADITEFHVDTREIDRQGPSFMVDTLRSLKTDYPDFAFCLIIGSDAYATFTDWHEWQTILELTHLLVMQRAGHAQPENPQLDYLRTTQCEDLRQFVSGKIYVQPVTQLEISATEIRRRVVKGEDIRFLVPDNIRTEIEHLYKG